MPTRKRKRSVLTPIVSTSNKRRRIVKDSEDSSSVKTPKSNTSDEHPAGCRCIACDILSLSAPPKKRRRLNVQKKKEKEKEESIEEKENAINGGNTESADAENEKKKYQRKRRKKSKKKKQSKTTRMPKASKSTHEKRMKGKRVRRHSIDTELIDPEKKGIIHRKLQKYFKWIRDEMEMEEFYDTVKRNVDVVEHGITRKEIDLIVKELHKEGKVMFDHGIIYKMGAEDMALYDRRLTVKLDCI